MPISKVESFLNSNFGPIQIYKIVLTPNQQIWSFNATDSLYIFIKDWRNA